MTVNGRIVIIVIIDYCTKPGGTPGSPHQALNGDNGDYENWRQEQHHQVTSCQFFFSLNMEVHNFASSAYQITNTTTQALAIHLLTSASRPCLTKGFKKVAGVHSPLKFKVERPASIQKPNPVCMQGHDMLNVSVLASAITQKILGEKLVLLGCLLRDTHCKGIKEEECKVHMGGCHDNRKPNSGGYLLVSDKEPSERKTLRGSLGLSGGPGRGRNIPFVKRRKYIKDCVSFTVTFNPSPIISQNA
ncbi:hypothetical protein GH733_013933 [Mirounga leonina]|nr:hypothetical protein GH733_013933 [Mirounga leonina]